MKILDLKTFIIIYMMLSYVCGCSTDTNNYPERNVNLFDLLLERNEISTELPVSYGPNIGFDEDRSTDSVRVAYIINLESFGWGCAQDIYRFKSIRIAKNDFSSAVIRYGSKYTPSDWTYQSQTADESQITQPFFCKFESEISIVL
jgi:hypothetical protein